MCSRNDYDVLTHKNNIKTSSSSSPNTFSPKYRDIQIELHSKAKTTMNHKRLKFLHPYRYHYDITTAQPIKYITPYFNDEEINMIYFDTQFVTYPVGALSNKAAGYIIKRFETSKKWDRIPGCTNGNLSQLFEAVAKKDLIEMDKSEYCLIQDFLQQPNWDKFVKVEVLLRRILVFNFQQQDEDYNILSGELQKEILKNMRDRYNYDNADALMDLLC